MGLGQRLVTQLPRTTVSSGARERHRRQGLEGLVQQEHLLSVGERQGHLEEERRGQAQAEEVFLGRSQIPTTQQARLVGLGYSGRSLQQDSAQQQVSYQY